MLNCYQLMRRSRNRTHLPMDPLIRVLERQVAVALCLVAGLTVPVSVLSAAGAGPATQPATAPLTVAPVGG